MSEEETIAPQTPKKISEDNNITKGTNLFLMFKRTGIITAETIKVMKSMMNGTHK